MSKYAPIMLAAILTMAGCVERKMTITSEPSGALVWVSDVEVGRTPVTISFTWYGDYDIILRKDGFETRKTHANIIMPWYEVPPLDLLSEIAPWTYRDNRYLHFKLDKRVEPSDADLIERAAELQKRTFQPVK